MGGRGIGALFERGLRHVLTPRSLAAVFLKNIQHAVSFRRPARSNELDRGVAERKRCEEALASYDKALTTQRNSPQIWTRRGTALRKLGRADEAEASVREALRLRPEFLDAHKELGRVLTRLGRLEEAEASVRELLRLKPDDAFAHYNLGYRLLNLGRASESEASFRTALSLQPNDPTFHTGLGQALLLAGQYQEGWKEYEWRWQTEAGVNLRSRLGDAVLER